MHVFGLRRTTLQPRLFQQACRLVSTKRVRRARLETATAYAARTARNAVEAQQRKQKSDDTEEEEGGIRWFEQDVETGVTRRVAGNPEELEARELREKIWALEKELQEYQSDTSDDTLLAGLEPEERKKVEKALQERREREHELVSGLEVPLELPPLSVPLLKRLNAALREAALNPHLVSRRKDLWRWYSRAKHNIPSLPSMIPQKAWQLLWDSQSQDSPTNPDRLVHMEQLVADMTSVGLNLVPEQDVVYIETLMSLDKLGRAERRWKKLFEQDPDPSHALYALGLKLFAQIGRLDRAHELLRELLRRFPDEDPRVVLPLLAANAAAGNDHLAFALYLLIRSKLASAMTMDDYDAVALTFLAQDKRDLALAVFRDMMLQGSKTLQEDSLSIDQKFRLYRAVFARMGILNFRAVTTFEANNVSLSAMSVLPFEWQNKFFYGSWLKKLIGMGQVDAAAKVVELMYERGVHPASKHINGLAGAFMRSVDPALQHRGEQLAWSMIQRQLEFAWRRRQEKRNEPVTPMPSAYETEEGLKIPPHLARTVPRATIETFNVLALHYFVKEQWAHIHHLDRLLRPAELKMDAFFMNHFLYMKMFNEGTVTAWRSFRKLSKFTPPDMETYNFLWTGLLRQLDPRRKSDWEEYPPPRQLFALMMAWLSGFRDEKKRGKAIDDFTTEIYAKIIQSFCSDRDYAGCLAALHGVAQELEHFPSHDIARIVITSVSNLPELEPPTIRGRRGRQQLPASESRLKNTSKVLAALAKRRATAALENGVDLAELRGEERQQENLNLLSEFIRVVLVRSNANADSVESSIVLACREMRLEGITTGDKDASNVI